VTGDEQLAEAFRDLSGHDVDGWWAAPGRVNLIGEHTDYNDGFVLPFAIDKRLVAGVRVDRGRDGGVLTARSLALEETAQVDAEGCAPGRVTGWAAYLAGVVWALREHDVDVPSVDVVIGGDLPRGAGLSSSAALTAVLAVALDDLLGLRLGVDVLATLCRRTENDFVGAPTGVMDQLAVLDARAGHALLIDCRSLERRRVPLALDDEELAVLVVDTGVPHDTAATGYARRRRECAEAAGSLGVMALRDAQVDDLSRLDGMALRRARHVVTENDRVLSAVELIGIGRLRNVGPLLTASQHSLRDDFEVSTPEIDDVVEALLDAGALGARLTGAGFGGAVIALVERAGLRSAAEAARPLLVHARSRAVSAFAVAPAGAASRIG